MISSPIKWVYFIMELLRHSEIMCANSILQCQAYISDMWTFNKWLTVTIYYFETAHNHEKSYCWEEECTYCTWQFFLITQELLIFAPQFPAVSFCYTWCSIRKFLCRFLQRQPAFRLWISSWVRWEILPFTPGRTCRSLKHRKEFNWLWDLD